MWLDLDDERDGEVVGSSSRVRYNHIARAAPPLSGWRTGRVSWGAGEWAALGQHGAETLLLRAAPAPGSVETGKTDLFDAWIGALQLGSLYLSLNGAARSDDLSTTWQSR